jgi:transposase-like protein
MIAAYEAGVTMKELASALGIHRNTVSDHLRQHGVPTRRRGLDENDTADAARLYEEGWSSLMIGKMYNVDPKTALTTLRKAGVHIRPRRGGPPAPDGNVSRPM